jgi:hypothetical protein
MKSIKFNPAKADSVLAAAALLLFHPKAEMKEVTTNSAVGKEDYDKELAKLEKDLLKLVAKYHETNKVIDKPTATQAVLRQSKYFTNAFTLIENPGVADGLVSMAEESGLKGVIDCVSYPYSFSAFIKGAKTAEVEAEAKTDK